MWKTEQDVLSTLDEVSVFTKNQRHVRNLKINTPRSEHRKKLRERRKQDRDGIGTEYRERNGVYLGDSESEYSSLDGGDVAMPFSVGRAQQINHYRETNQERCNPHYVHAQVQKAIGNHCNKAIEENYLRNFELNAKTKGVLRKDENSQFADAEDYQESKIIASSVHIKTDESSDKENTTKTSSSGEKFGEKSDSQSGSGGPESVVRDDTKLAVPTESSVETRPPLRTKERKVRNVILQQYQDKIARNEKTQVSSKKDADSEINVVPETNKQDPVYKNDAVTETDKEDSKSEKTVDNSSCESGNIDFRIHSNSTVVEFKPSSRLKYSPSKTVEFKPRVNYNDGSNFENNPDVGTKCDPESNVKRDLASGVENDFGTSVVEYNPDTGIEHDSEASVRLGAGTGVEYNPEAPEFYPGQNVNRYSNTGEYYAPVGLQYYPNTGVQYYPSASGEYSINPIVPYTAYMHCPNSGVQYNPEYFSAASAWSDLPNSSAFCSDPLFAPTTERMVQDFQYREEEFPPL